MVGERSAGLRVKAGVVFKAVAGVILLAGVSQRELGKGALQFWGEFSKEPPWDPKWLLLPLSGVFSRYSRLALRAWKEASGKVRPQTGAHP